MSYSQAIEKESGSVKNVEQIPIASTHESDQKITSIRTTTLSTLQSSTGPLLNGTDLGAPVIDKMIQQTKGKEKERRFESKKYEELFPDSPCRLPLDHNTQDIERHYSSCLSQAKKQNFVEEQIFCLLKISEFYVQKKDFFKAAQLINCAIAIAAKIPNISEYLFSRLKLIEELFLKAHKIRIPTKREQTIEEHRETLRVSRLAAETSQRPIQETLSNLTESLQNILKKIIAESMHILGLPPVQWACIGMGSMSRREMCPYSDIEFAFLLGQDTPDAVEYFRTLSKIIKFKVIALGETPFPVFGWEHQSPLPDGFCLDSAGNTPLGVQDLYELIGTPIQLAQFQSFKWIRDSIILPNILSTVCLLSGDPKLLSTYTQAKQKVQQQIAKEGFKNEEKLAERLLTGHLHEFRPDLCQEKKNQTAFNIKQELYRPLQEILSSLAIRYQLKSQNSFDRIDELQQIGVFSTTGAENLKKALAKVLSLRLQVHFFYQEKKEFLYHPDVGMTQKPSLLYLRDQPIEVFIEIYQILIPFHRCIDEFHQTKDKSSLNCDNFFDNSPSVQGFIFEINLQYTKAQNAYQQALLLNPNHVDTLLRLGNIENFIKKRQEALSRYQKALAIAKQKHGENHLDVADIYVNIGLFYENLDRYDTALKCYQKNSTIRLSVLGENHPDMARCYKLTGNVWNQCDEYSKAFEFYQKALGIELLVLGENHLDVADTYTKSGFVCENLEEYNKALEFYQRALKIKLSVLGKNHPDVAAAYTKIAIVYDVDLMRYAEALPFYQNALMIQLFVLDEHHHDVVDTYINIGSIYNNLGVYTEALKFYLTALQIQLLVLGENHPEVAKTCNTLGNICNNLKEYAKAIDYHQRALKIYHDVGKHHMHLVVANIHIAIGADYYKLEQLETAFQYFEEALKIWLQAYGEDYSNIKSVLENLIACTHQTLSSTVENLQAFATLCLEILEKDDPIAPILSAL